MKSCCLGICWRYTTNNSVSKPTFSASFCSVFNAFASPSPSKLAIKSIQLEWHVITLWLWWRFPTATCQLSCPFAALTCTAIKAFFRVSELFSTICPSGPLFSTLHNTDIGHWTLPLGDTCFRTMKPFQRKKRKVLFWVCFVDFWFSFLPSACTANCI